MYLGFETYSTINAVLPRLDGVGRASSHFDNPSMGAQFSEVSGKLFDLQQALAPYIAYLLRNPDQLLYVSETNLASCQKELGNLHGPSEPAQPMKNTFVEFHARRRNDGRDAKKKTGESTDKKTDPPSPRQSH